MPIDIINGLAYMSMEPFTDEQFEQYPSVFFTCSGVVWKPDVLDHTITDDECWYDAISDLQKDPVSNLFDEYGNYHHREAAKVTVDDHVQFFNAAQFQLTDFFTKLLQGVAFCDFCCIIMNLPNDI